MDSGEIKSIIFDCLCRIFQPETTAQAENQLSQLLESDPGCSVLLAQLLVDPSTSPDVRVLAGVVLRQFVAAHWSPKLESFQTPEIPGEAKAALRALLPGSLGDSERRVRTAVATVISVMGQCDWPEAWPGVVEELTNVLVNGTDAAVVDGVAICLDLLVCGEGLNEASFHAMVNIVLPKEAMLSALMKAELPSPCRARIVSVFVSILSWTITVKANHAASSTVMRYLPAWMEALVALLGATEDLRGDCALKINCLKAMVLLFSSFPKQVSPYVAGVLSPLFKPLVECVEFYECFVVSDNMLDEVKNSEGDVLGFSPFLLLLVEMFHILNEKPYYRRVLQPFVGELIHVCIAYMQITAEQLELWEDDPNEFVAAEDDEAWHYNLRVSGIQLLQQLCTTFPKEFVHAFKPVASTWLAQGDALKAAGDARWWRVREAVVMASGSCVGLLGEAPPQVFDLSVFISSVLLPDMHSGVPLLCGRALWCSAQLAHKVDPEASYPFVEAAVTCLQNERENLQVKVCSCRAMASFAPKVPAHVVSACLEPTMQAVVGMFRATTEDTLHLVLETLHVLIRIDAGQTAKVAATAATGLVGVWAAHASDLLITQDCVDALGALCNTPGCAEPLTAVVLPVVLSLLREYLTSDEAVKPEHSGRVEAALELAGALVHGNTPSSPGAPVLVNEGFPLALAVVRTTDDHSIMNAGTLCLAAYAKVYGEVLATAWKSPEGHSGLQCILEVLDRLLMPEIPDTAAMQVGRLITKLVHHCSAHLGDILPVMLRRAVERLRTAVMDDLICALVLVFARLIVANAPEVVPFLRDLTLGDGSNALHFILGTWVKNHQNFAGSLSIKVSMYGLTFLLANADEALLAIQVPGELIPPEGRTRRSTRLAGQTAERWTQVPLGVKVLSLVVQELIVIEEVAHADELEKQFVDYDGEDGLELSAMAAFDGYEAVGTLLDSFVGDAMDDDYDEDEDAKQDPLYSLDLKEHLVSFLKSYGETNPLILRSYAERLNVMEQQFLLKVLKPE